MAPSFRLSSAPESADEATAHKGIYDQLRRVAETFPSAPSLIGLPCSRHPDGWYTFTNGVVSSMVIKEHLTARATDIFLTTFPKSGTTWLKAFLYSTLHRGTDELVAHSPHQLVPFLESQVFVNDRIPDLSSLPSPRLFMTHIPSQSLPDSVATSGCKVVYLCRDPKDCFVSLWHFWNRFMSWDIDEAHQQFCDGVSQFGPFWEHILGYWRWHVEKPNQVLFLTYEELVADTLGQLRRLAEFVGCPFTTEEQKHGVDRNIVEACALENMSGLEVNRSGTITIVDSTVPNNTFFRRGMVGDWRNHLTPEMARRIDKITESRTTLFMASSSTAKAADGATPHEEIYDQLRQVVETFPAAVSGIGQPYCRHPNGWYMSRRGVVSAMAIKRHLTARTTDVFIATFPKSGTTWLKALLYSALQHDAHELAAHSPHQLVPFLESQLFVNDRIPDLSLLPEPRLLTTHIPAQSLPDSIAASGSKVVYLCRDPKDCFVSLWHFWNRFISCDIDVAVRQFCDGISHFGPFWEHVLGYWRWHVEPPSQVFFLTYKELAADTLGLLRRLAKFVGRPFTVEEQKAGVDRKILEICAMESLSRLEVNLLGATDFIEKDVPNNIFFRRGVVGDWRNYLTPEMAMKIDEITEIKFKGTGLLFHPQLLREKGE
uniref:Sulfotransferase domain-containing protein n=1 Tax=Oryza meridionalis TaxID=40149 RepID=A0A0E0F9D6_9ORYZ